MGSLFCMKYFYLLHLYNFPFHMMTLGSIHNKTIQIYKNIKIQPKVVKIGW